MAEVIFILALAAPFVLMVWLIRARNRSQAMVAEIEDSQFERDRYATEEGDTAADGLVHGRHHYADHDLIPPDNTGGEPAGIRAMQGRR
jgi:hypothetical protein